MLDAVVVGDTRARGIVPSGTGFDLERKARFDLEESTHVTFIGI